MTQLNLTWLKINLEFLCAKFSWGISISICHTKRKWWASHHHHHYSTK